MMIRYRRNISLGLLLIVLLLGLTACAPTQPQKDPLAERIDVITLPKFGFDPHWGGREIPEKILQQRVSTLGKLAERGETPDEFSLEVTKIGWDALSQSDFNTAIRRFNQAWLIHPQSAFAIMGMAMVVYERDGDIQGALSLMESLQEPLGGEPTYWINLASMEKRANMPLEALKHFEIAAQLAPSDPIIVLGLIELYSKTTNFSSACAQLSKARKLEISVETKLSRFIEANAQSQCQPS